LATKLSQSFTLDEFVFSQTAARLGIDNRPTSEHVEAMRALCIEVLQPLRDSLQGPLVISSGFRSPRLNKSVGGAASSQHMKGEAADIVAPSIPVRRLFKRMLELDLPFDQLIHEGSKQSAWVHVSFNPARLRKEIFSATFSAEGVVTYTKLSRTAALAL
jgi:zinc D-Ala-D-Ala carboxypeptidase